MESPFEIREARPDEAASYTAFARDIFVKTYVPGNDPRLVSEHIRLSFDEALQAAELADPARRVLVIDAPDGGWGAFASMRAGVVPGQDDTPAPIEVERFYICQEWHGAGVAQQLMQDVIDRARADGFVTLWLGVWQYNHRAIRFYEKMGFAHVGWYTFMFGGEPEDDVLMTRRL